jgi:predicted DNA binding CopG/RHH family protein
MGKKAKRIEVPISKELYNRLKRLADAQGLSVDDFADKIIARGWKQRKKEREKPIAPAPLFSGDKK